LKVNGGFSGREGIVKKVIRNYNDPRFRKFIKHLGGLATMMDMEHWGDHDLNVACLSFLLAVAVDRPLVECDRIGKAAYLHDLGKHAAWMKHLFAPGKGKHTPEEARERQEHGQAGVELFALLLEELYEVGQERLRARLQHQLDARTIQLVNECQIYHDIPYVRGQKDIPLVGRICRIADAYDTMVAKNHCGRKYRKRKTDAQAREELLRCCGIDFDPDLVRLFLDLVLIPLQTKGRSFRPFKTAPTASTARMN